ncbi:hypothetical protein BGX28_000935 [Mortierella sp. GBA30]|nr:hypothetical protein BGX28_000935 [Mortierella sp. GBA30]
MMFHMRFNTLKHEVVINHNRKWGARRIKFSFYSGGGFRWTKREISAQIGTLLFKQTVTLGTRWEYEITLNEDLEDAISYINIKFGDDTFTKASVIITNGTPDWRELMKQRIEMNRHLKLDVKLDEGAECCLIL